MGAAAIEMPTAHERAMDRAHRHHAKQAKAAAGGGVQLLLADLRAALPLAKRVSERLRRGRDDRAVRSSTGRVVTVAALRGVADSVQNRLEEVLDMAVWWATFDQARMLRALEHDVGECTVADASCKADDAEAAAQLLAFAFSAIAPADPLATLGPDAEQLAALASAIWLRVGAWDGSAYRLPASKRWV